MPSKVIPADSNPYVADLRTIQVKERSGEYEDFLKYVSSTTGHLTYGELSILYPAICQAAMEWLLVQKKSVDFGFVVLHPSPHRANWKQIMVALFPTLGPVLLGKSRAVREALLTSSGFDTKLLSGELLAIARERYVVWGIEPELKRSWWKAMYRHEAAKLSALGSVQYAAYTAKQIVKLRTKLTRAYLSFLRQVAYPCAKIQFSRVYRRGFIVPYVPKGRVRPVTVSDIPVCPVVPRSPEELATPSVSEVVGTDAGVPEVSNLPPVETDLRLSERTQDSRH